MLKLKNRTVFNSLYELDATCFTKDNSSIAPAGTTLPYGVLGGTVAMLSDDYEVAPATGADGTVAVGLFVNDANGNPFDNAPAVASNKIALACKLASVEVDIYAADITTQISVGAKLYSDADGYLTAVESANEQVIGIVTKAPTASDPLLGLELSI